MPESVEAQPQLHHATGHDLRAAVSLAERPEETDLETTDGTPTAFEEIAHRSNDRLLGLDDFGAALARSGAAAQLIREIAFKGREGKGRRRSKVGEAFVGHGTLKWLTVIVTNGEVPIAQMTDRLPGEQVRFIDIHVAEKEKGGIFDLLPEEADPIAEGRRLAQLIRTTISANYGLALRGFIHDLTMDRAGYQEKAQRAAQKFLRTLAKRGIAAGEQSRYQEAFAKVYAAGWLAYRLGIAPFTGKQVKNAVLEVYTASELAQQAIPRLRDEAIVELGALIADEHHCLRLKKGEAVPEKRRSETWATARAVKDRVVLGVLPKHFKTIVRPHLMASVIAKLREAEVLRPSSSKVSTGQMQVKGLVAGDDRPRLFCLDAEKLIALITNADAEGA